MKRIKELESLLEKMSEGGQHVHSIDGQTSPPEFGSGDMRIGAGELRERTSSEGLPSFLPACHL